MEHLLKKYQKQITLKYKELAELEDLAYRGKEGLEEEIQLQKDLIKKMEKFIERKEKPPYEMTGGDYQLLSYVALGGGFLFSSNILLWCGGVMLVVSLVLILGEDSQNMA